MAEKKRKSRSFFDLSSKERDEVAKKLDRESLYESSRPMSPKSRLLWELAKKRRARPKLGVGAVKVLVSFDPELLERVDEYAKGKKLKRSQLIAIAVRREMTRAGK